MTRETRHYFDISIYSDITIERCIQKAGMMRENAKAIFTAIYKDAIPLFWLISRNAIASIFRQCRYPARLIQRNPAPSSRQDYCKPVALSHLAIENNKF